ncbi:uncharacterized protein LOC134694458 [Mytilus trossulus]|uniref:uncharacterized protein LOC134694458 n=1 Tax=Mytilus trossulus TaxID=6551 RepID=UPI0030070101
MSFGILGLPIEVKRFDKKSAKVFSSLLEEESYPHFESRVMLVGEQGTGKTTIARYLVGKRPSRFRIATNGIELFNGLSYIDRQTKDWLCGRQDFSLEELAVSRSLLQEDKREKNVVSQIKTFNSQYIPDMRVDMSLSADEGKQKQKPTEPSSSDTTFDYDFDSVSSTQTVITEHVKTTSHHQLKIEPVHSGMCRTDMQHINRVSERLSCRVIDDIQSSDFPSNRNQPEVHTYRTAVKKKTDSMNERELIEAQHDTVLDDTCLETRLKGDMHIQTFTKPGVISKLKHIFGVSKTVKEVKVSITKENFLKKSINAGKMQLHNKMIAPIIIWDFGGHDVFYSTHQTFLTYRAIYIIVLDGSRTLDDPCQHEQYVPGKSGPKTAKDYLRFWINAIVTYCKGSIECYPKIMIVLTHKDQVKHNEVEQRRNKLFSDIKQMFKQTQIMNQLVIEDMIFVNAKDKYDTEMAKIKSTIIRESERQPTWGERLPKCFIPLELEFKSLIKHKIPLITLGHLKKINSQQPIRPLSDLELRLFLKFQHSIGKVLYFDEHNLNNHVILAPTHLINAFKSIITDRKFSEGDRTREELWDVMSKTGVISKKIIRQVWKKKKYLKFYKDKEYLLDVMTHLDILVDPKRYDNDRKRIPADFYYIASMVRTNDDSGYLQSASFTHRSITIAFQSTSLMIPPALSFRFISYCLYVWAVKKYGQTNKDMLFHRSALFTIDPSLDLHILCEDERIIARLVHARTNSLIMRDLASSITECLNSALEKISQLYIRASSDQHYTSDASFITRICCNSPDNPCVLQVREVPNIGEIWICPAHGIEHKIHIITSWFSRKNEDKCDAGCPVTNEDFLKVTPSDIHLRRMSLLYSRDNVRELAIRLGLSTTAVDNMLDTDDPRKWNFEVLRQCRNSVNMTFNHIKEAIEASGQHSIHRLCKLVKGGSIDFETQREMWDLVPVDEHIDRLAPLVGNNSLPFLIELGMEFQTWEQICYRQNERDLVRLNKDIFEEWRNKFCTKHSLKPTLRTIAQAFSYIGKSVQIVENTLSDLL